MASESSTEKELVGAVTGGYRVLARIGSGTMGHVYEAEDVSNGKHVALKVLRKGGQKDLAARFMREGKTLALLSHPNIVQLVDMGQLDDGTLFLATELVPADSLRVLMDRGPIAHRRALSIVRQILEALSAAHDLGVVHRDIKPENVMVGADDYVKVLDFGVAKLLADTVAGLGEANLTSIGFSIFGSALYIAPESVTGQPVDARIDLYSTGAMLFEMVAGRPPFNDQDPAVLLRQHAFEAPPTLQQAAPAQAFAPELEAFVSRALAKQPDDRYRSAADMNSALDAVMRVLDRPVAVVEPAIAATPARAVIDQRRLQTEPVRGSKHTKLWIVVGAALALVVVIVLATRGGSKPSPGALAARAITLAQSGSNLEAVELLERELVGRATAEQAPAYLALGHARFKLGRTQQALAAYERALRAAPSVGGDAELRANLLKVLDGNGSLASVVALDLLATLTPPAQDAIAQCASSGKLDDARHRAMMIAERDGITVDRVQSWLLDLQQAPSCEDRKATIELLARSSDRRALAGLKRARMLKCVEREATDAIARIEATAK